MPERAYRFWEGLVRASGRSVHAYAIVVMSVDVDLWARRSLQRGVSWYTDRRYAFDGQSKPFARFSFAWLNERELPEAVKRMAAAQP